MISSGVVIRVLSVISQLDFETIAAKRETCKSYSHKMHPLFGQNTKDLRKYIFQLHLKYCIAYRVWTLMVYGQSKFKKKKK